MLWIRNAEELQNGVHLINQIDKIKFQKLLTHITNNIGQKNESGIFTSEELASLEKVLKLNEEEALVVVKTIRHILKRLSRFLMRPSSILEDLTNSLKIDQDKSAMFVEKYKALVKNVTDEFEISNMNAIGELKQANWQVNLEMTSNKNQLERCPMVLFEFETNKTDNLDKLVVELDEIGLKGFHQQLENIQNEVDNILSQDST